MTQMTMEKQAAGPQEQLPELFREVPLGPTAQLIHAAGVLATMETPLPPTLSARIPERLRPIVGARQWLGHDTQQAVNHVTALLPGLEYVRQSVDAGEKVDPVRLTPYMEHARGLAPLAESVIQIAPQVAAPANKHKQEQIRGRFRPVLNRLAKVSTIIGLGVASPGGKIDRKLAQATANYINGHHDEMRGHLQSAYEQYAVPFAAQAGPLLDKLIDESDQPRAQFMNEAGRLADAIWARADAEQGGKIDGKVMGRAIEAELRTRQAAKDQTRQELPLLTRLGLDRVPNLPATVAIPDKLKVRAALSLKGFQYERREGKIHIPMADVLGVLSPYVMGGLEAAAGREKQHAARLDALDDNLHPLFGLVARVPRFGKDLQKLDAVIPALRAVRQLLPKDRAHAERMVQALAYSIRPGSGSTKTQTIKR